MDSVYSIFIWLTDDADENEDYKDQQDDYKRTHSTWLDMGGEMAPRPDPLSVRHATGQRPGFL